MIYVVMIIIITVLFGNCIRSYKYESWSHPLTLAMIACVIFWILDITNSL